MVSVMQLRKDLFIRYIELFSVCAAILNVVKFALQRDMAALRTISVIVAVTFAVFALYLTFVAPRFKLK